MLNDLIGYCSKLTLFPLYANEYGINYKGTIDDKYFSLVRNESSIRITTLKDCFEGDVYHNIYI